MKEKNVSKDIISIYMKKYRIKFVVIELILIAVLILYFLWCKPYIINYFQGAVDFDAESFRLEAGTVQVSQEVEIHRNDDTTIPSYSVRAWSYWQDDKYEFHIPVTDVEKTDIQYTNSVTQTGTKGTKKQVSSVVYTADIEGKKVVLLAYPHHVLSDGDVVDGIFTRIPLIVKHDIANSEFFEPGEEICEYMLDIRGLEMESEWIDVVFCAVLGIIIIYLAIKLVRQFSDYTRTPIYRQLDKYDDCLKIEKWISEELEAGYKIEDKKIITENWIISKDVFKLKIVKNHMSQGKFDYVKVK
ncbi:MAG: hypothetical protein II998_08610 [Clostridia bacterium]|nr:hypothetical protein [Clostridia bacterium]